MRLRRHVFDEVSVTATRRWKDEDGKKRQETRKFWQSVNQFNVNKATGLPKSREEIYAEIVAQRTAWLNEPKP